MADPVERFRELAAELRQLIAHAAYVRGAASVDAMVDELTGMRYAEGRLLGFLEAVRLLRPDLAVELRDEAEALMRDLNAVHLTMGLGRPEK